MKKAYYACICQVIEDSAKPEDMLQSGLFSFVCWDLNFDESLMPNVDLKSQEVREIIKNKVFEDKVAPLYKEKKYIVKKVSPDYEYLTWYCSQNRIPRKVAVTYLIMSNDLTRFELKSMIVRSKPISNDQIVRNLEQQLRRHGCPKDSYIQVLEWIIL